MSCNLFKIQALFTEFYSWKGAHYAAKLRKTPLRIETPENANPETPARCKKTVLNLFPLRKENAGFICPVWGYTNLKLLKMSENGKYRTFPDVPQH